MNKVTRLFVAAWCIAVSVSGCAPQAATGGDETSGHDIYKAAATGNSHSLAVKQDGSLWAFGLNWSGQLGDGTFTDSRSPVKIMDDVERVAAGSDHSLAIKTDGSLWAWGDNSYGQLGDGTRTAYNDNHNQSTPVKIMDDAAYVEAVGFQSMVIKTDGSLWVWGESRYGQLGDGTIEDRSKPDKIMDDVACVAAGSDHSLAVKTDGSLWGWGYGWDGQLGADRPPEMNKQPFKIMDDVARVAAGSDHSLAIKTDGSLWTWGDNSGGQLGDGTFWDSSNPIKIIDDAAHIEAGGDHSLAIKTDGSLWAWGDNYYGRLSDNAFTYTDPIKIMDDVACVAAGSDHNLTIKTDGSLWVWGDNSYGQLGDGTNADKDAPAKVSGAAKSPDLPADSIESDSGAAEDTVTVENIEQFIEAVAPNTHILMKPGLYDLGEFICRNGYDDLTVLYEPKNEYVYWETVLDWGLELVIKNVENLTIEGDAAGPVEIVTPHGYAYVMNFENCKNIEIKHITAGHSIESGCRGGVFMFDGCSNAVIEHTLMYGCGIIGLTVGYSDHISVRESSVYECTQGIASIGHSEYVDFTNCDFYDNEGFTLMDIIGSHDILIETCGFINNSGYDGGDIETFFNIRLSSKIHVKNCTFKDNAPAKTFFSGVIRFE